MHDYNKIDILEIVLFKPLNLTNLLIIYPIVIHSQDLIILVGICHFIAKYK